MRLVAWDDAGPFVVVNALDMVIYLPAWLIVAVALRARRWALACLAFLVVAAQLIFVVPELLSAAPVPAWAHGAPRIRLLDANVDKSTTFRLGYARAIRHDHPDIITLEEFTPHSLDHMVATGVLRHYPFRCLFPQYGPTGFLIASRLHLTHCSVHSVRWDDGRTPYMVSAELTVAGTGLQLRVVHTLAPFPSSWNEWMAAMHAVDEITTATPTQNVLMVGDFNATWGNRDFVSLLSDGMTDAAADRGRAFTMTWPNGALVPPFVRIDHLLTGKRLTAVAIATHEGFGSDHQYLTATVAVHT
jgi:endonuclease/exonuclease/phosphatase (EEP) superfamily protein YafD